jgi:proteasome lid subunit RPN8/RPN11
MVKDNNLFSSDYAVETVERWGDEIKNAFEELERITGREVRCVRWNDNYVAAAFTIKVDLPSRGPVGGGDIRPEEPIMLVFSRRDYPELAPMVRSDRKDFLVEILPHLNPVDKGQPPYICLHRGNINDWFAEHTLEDLVMRTKDWFRDAATNRLIRSNDYFEPTRLNDLKGSAIFAPQTFKEWIERGWESTKGKAGFGFLLMKLLDPAKRFQKLDGFFPVKVQAFFTKDENDLFEILSKVKEVNSLIEERDDLAPWCFGILAWTNQKQPLSKYFGVLPHNAGELFEMCREIGIPLKEALKTYSEQGLLLLNGLPIIVGLHRPRPLIKSNLDVEPLCFVVNAGDEKSDEEGVIHPSASTYVLGHRSPLNKETAAEISGQKDIKQFGRILLLGCGALGSKIGLHLGRSGQTALTLVDFDTFSPHNLVRHALLSDASGKNKAEALKKSIVEIYENLPENQFPVAHTASALDWLKGERQEEMREHDLLIDATASGMVLEAAIKSKLPETLTAARAEIADLGKIGILSVEGDDRNPRLDDLNILLRDIAVDQPQLSAWLQSERKTRAEGRGPVLEEIAIGLSCASDTMRLSDDLVSWHASSFSIALRDILQKKDKNPSPGYLIINHSLQAHESLGAEGLVSRKIPVEPFLVLPSFCVRGYRVIGADAWQIRIRSEVAREMRRRLTVAAPNETGGLMVGVVHSKRRIIYVTRIVNPPDDSEGSYSGFSMGTIELPEELDRVKKASGDLLGFVGDWHSHPRGSGKISTTDMEAMMTTKRNFDRAGMPTFILIVSHRHFYAYVSNPGQ